MTIPSIDQIFTTMLPYVIGAIGGIGSMFLSGFSKEFFDERSRVAKHKREVARHVLKICNEASTGSFRIPPLKIEDVNSTLTDLEGIDQEISKEMEKLVSSWSTFARERSQHGLSPDDVRFAKSQLDRAERKRKILVAWANKIRNGN